MNSPETVVVVLGNGLAEECGVSAPLPEDAIREDVLECPLGGVLAQRHQRSFIVEVYIGAMKPTLATDVLGDYLPEETPEEWSPTRCVGAEMEESLPGIIRLFWDGDLERGNWAVFEHLEILGYSAPFGMGISGGCPGSIGFSVYILCRLKEDAEIPDGGLDEVMDDVLQALQVTWQLGRYLFTMGYWEEFHWTDITSHGLPGAMERVSGLECFY